MVLLSSYSMVIGCELINEESNPSTNEETLPLLILYLILWPEILSWISM